jgi:DNA replication and repair protein RecF
MRLADAVGTFAIVFILPEDINITSGSPKHHRSFLDIYLSQISRSYLTDLTEYQRVLKQRNALLKKLRGTGRVESKSTRSSGQLDVWDEAIIGPAFRIMAARKIFIDEIRPKVLEISRLISGGADIVEIAYRPRLEFEETAGIESGKSQLRKERERDLRMGASLLGPHRDIIEIRSNGELVREYGSMGQKKTVMLAMKMAALGALSEHRGEPAILVLDEAFAVLDSQREKHLLGLLSDGGFAGSCGQVFLASAVATALDGRTDVKVFEVRAGTVNERANSQ